MHRFFIPQAHGYNVGQTLVLPEEPAHQVRHVLRMRPDDQILVLDNQGRQYTVTLEKVTRDVVFGEVTAQAAASGEPSVHLTLYQAWLKRDNFEWILQKGTELGVARFVPVVTRRSVIRETAVKPNKLSRWQRIITEAAEQCGRARLPELAEPLTLEDAFAQAQRSLAFIPWEEAQSGSVRQALATASAASAPEIALFIGPEGGFDPEEVAAAQENGIRPVTLGPRVLRSETAAIVAAALFLYELGQLE